MTYFQYDLLVRGGLVLITIKELIDLKELRAFICEREFSAAHRILCDALQMRIPLKEVQLAYPRPPHFSAYKKAFQCPVRFNAATHRVVFDSKYLLMRLPMANPLMKKTYEKECRQLCLRLQVQKSVSDQVRQNIFFGADGRPSMSQLSRNLSVSSRTLRRWLAEEGTSFKVLSSEIIREKAIHLIQTTSWSMERIAAELGYSNLPNFYRAFGHWTGRKPGDYRGKNRWRKPP